MKQILEKNNLTKPPKIGEIVKGQIINKEGAAAYLDLGVWGTGIIYGKEFYKAKNNLKDLEVGDTVFVKIIDLENEDGYIETSLTEAGKELAWDTIKQKKENDETLTVKISGANKGGLLAKVSGIQAFLPSSQLSSGNYPKVEDGDNQKILKELQKLVGEEMEVKIFDYDPKEEKLILSEKAKENKKIKEILEDYKVGDVVKGEITGVVDFGAFVKIPLNKKKYGDDDEVPDHLEGLIHISELDWQLIEDPSDIVKTGDKVEAKIIDISDNKISLSLKALKKDPWEGIEKKYKKGDVVKGKVTKINPYGAFVQLSPKVQGLCHISEFSSQPKLEEELKVDTKYDFEIVSIEPEEHRMSLKLKK